MNGENNHVFHTSALDGYVSVPRPQFTWALFLAQLWLLAAFLGMSLVAVAAKLVLGDAQAQPAAALALALIGALVTPVAWWNVARALRRAETRAHNAPRASVIASPATAHARITGMTPTL